MTPHEEDKMSMYKTLLGIFDRFPDIIAGIPELETSIASFRSTVSSILQYDEQSKTARSGKYETKQNAKHNFIQLLVPAVKSLRSYARKNKLEDIIELTGGITQSKLLRLNKAEFDSRTDMLYASLDANKANLAGFNITEEKVNALKASMDVYDTAEKEHLASGSERSAAHKNREEAFDTADDILNEDIDGMMEHFRQENSDFYNMYVSGRVIKDISGSKAKETVPEEPADQPQ